MNSIVYRLSTHSKEEKTSSLDLVKESFGSGVDIVYEEYYEWQYLKNPIGRGNVLLAYDGQKAIGQIASIPCVYQILDKYFLASSIMNLSVSSQYQGKGIMGQLLTQILQTNGSSFSVVVPNAAAIKGYLKKYFHPMPLTFMVRPIRLSNYFHNHPVARACLKPFDIIWKNKKISDKFDITEYVSMFDERFDDLFNATNDYKTIRQVRDSKFLNWRYRNNPRRRYYTLIATGKNGILEGYVILRFTKIFGKSMGLIMDLVTRKGSDSGRTLIVSALDFFWINGTALAMAICFPQRKEYELLRKEGFFVCPTRFRPHPLTLCLKTSHEDQVKIDTILNPKIWFFMFGDYETF
jgi:ribosomal protein S18 acetylase RimI-like enzyme